MDKLMRDIEALGGVASMAELLRRDHWREWIEIALRYRSIQRVRKGWYASAGEPRQMVRAWRVGGRLACHSAIAYHLDEPEPRMLHVEVLGNTARLRSPDNMRAPLTEGDEVIVHWARNPSPGGRRAVSLAAAQRQAAACADRSCSGG
jgi:hypothetical protein